MSPYDALPGLYGGCFFTDKSRINALCPEKLRRSRIVLWARIKLSVVVVVVVVFTLKTVLTSIQYPSLSYSSRQRNEFPWSHANPK